MGRGIQAPLGVRYRSIITLASSRDSVTSAVISGVVTKGWGKGNPVTGEYTQITCDHDGLSTDCWQGSLELVPIAEPVVAARR